MSTGRYSVDVAWSEEDAAFVAVSPEWEGLSAVGSTAAEAAAELERAIALAVDVSVGEGAVLPAPRLRVPYSGQFRVRLPQSLHAWLSEEAAREGVSLNSFVMACLAQARGGHHAIRMHGEQAGLLTEEERDAMLRVYAAVTADIPDRNRDEVERELAEVRSARRAGGRRSGGAG